MTEIEGIDEQPIDTYESLRTAGLIGSADELKGALFYVYFLTTEESVSFYSNPLMIEVFTKTGRRLVSTLGTPLQRNLCLEYAEGLLPLEEWPRFAIVHAESVRVKVSTQEPLL